jgi:hypothetical protein
MKKRQTEKQTEKTQRGENKTDKNDEREMQKTTILKQDIISELFKKINQNCTKLYLKYLS